MKLQTFKPGTKDHDSQAVAMTLSCWNCLKDFTVYIGWGNINASLFDCPHCKETCEID